MKGGVAKPVRCAIYTRVSTDQGLEQDFNSLDAQYDASQSYIRSQAHAGWTLVRGKYDDGGFSGGNTDRPALQRLLEDVQSGKVDVIVVYKVDRLTRSLADFAKLVELFDKQNVSFVSVTQQFNTTTSMGRLTLNVLLSFAQFEREVTSERIRDKIAASKRKGLWVGGMAPLGYDTKDRKITVNEAETDTVRTIFRSYLKLGSLNLLMADLRKQGIVSKIRTLKTGDTVGGIPFTRGGLAHLLRNRFYVGEVPFKGEILRGEQTAIVDQGLFDAVQAKLSEQINGHKAARMKSEALLAGRIFDDRGNRMTPSHACKRGIKYRYYLSSTLLQGQAERSGSVRRIPATEIEALVIRSVRDRLKPSAPIDDRSLVDTHVARVEVQPEQLVIQLAQPERTNRKGARAVKTLRVPWHKTPSKRRREILLPDALDPQHARPIRSETRATFVASIARGRRWLNELVDDAKASVESIAKRERCSVRQVNMTISLAFVAPDLVKAAIEGRLPRGIGVTRLRDAPVEWSRQHAMLGLTG
ncbi:MAG: recombinase family protein [Pseudolabrys sp.]